MLNIYKPMKMVKWRNKGDDMQWWKASVIMNTLTMHYYSTFQNAFTHTPFE